ncbi:hypothetical protein PO878_00660 [Iamia majanohamensis]|uniref:GatB/YqeY domain-containing protein n=1 Tax=Iamia majanohamensis TaxID=467976 RepID=A0AAE9YEQ8_9ACTN|nr:hypothetical protein [Iamia majanohamensis]WCO67232.1 hypothetical protein PO878_00660 [Iamia majanohamensis]
MEDHPTDLRTALRTRLRDAMRARDRPAMQVLRVALSAVENAEAVADDERTQSERWAAASHAVDVPRRQVSEEEVRALVTAELEDRVATAAWHRDRGQGDEAATADAQAATLRAVLGDDDAEA